ncbi:MAG: hypothetical protein DME06_15600, partial [Candidatus Rokuibacteriota bacterium]
ADAPELSLVRAWLGTWSGIGLVAAGMARQGYDLSLTRYDERGWRATFYVTGMEHSATGATGSAFESTPWLAVHQEPLQHEQTSCATWHSRRRRARRLTPPDPTGTATARLPPTRAHRRA